MACILLWRSAARVHDSQAYRKMDVTRERISRILELRKILLSFQTGFSLVNVAVVCANLESISGLESSSVITEPRAVGRSFGPIREGRRSRPSRVSQLWVKKLVPTRHHWADIFIVRRQGPDGRKGSTNSTATCSTWRGIGLRQVVLCPRLTMR